MIFDVLKDRKLKSAAIFTTAALFLFSYVLLREDLRYSMAIACIPFPAYCIWDKSCVLRKLKSYDSSGGALYLKEGLNLVLMDQVLAFCVFRFSAGSLMCTTIAVVLYTLTDVILLLSIGRTFGRKPPTK